MAKYKILVIALLTNANTKKEYGQPVDEDELALPAKQLLAEGFIGKWTDADQKGFEAKNGGKTAKTDEQKAAEKKASDERKSLEAEYKKVTGLKDIDDLENDDLQEAIDKKNEENEQEANLKAARSEYKSLFKEDAPEDSTLEEIQAKNQAKKTQGGEPESKVDPLESLKGK